MRCLQLGGGHRRRAARDDLERLLVDALDLALGVALEDVAELGELVQVLALEEAVGERRVVRVEHVRADLEADELEQLERRHRQAERAGRLLDDLERGAGVDRVHRLAEHLGEDAVDDEPGACRVVMTAFLRSFAAVTIAVASVSSFVFGVLTTSMSGMTATGLKKWKPTTRSGCLSFAPICSTESDEVFVARIAVSEMYCSTSAKTSCLTPSSSKTASMTQSQSAKSALSVVPVTSALRRLDSSGRDAALLEQRVDLVVDVLDALVDARLVEVGDDDRHLQATHEQQRELAGHEAGADDADLGDRLARAPCPGHPPASWRASARG